MAHGYRAYKVVIRTAGSPGQGDLVVPGAAIKYGTPAMAHQKGVNS
jgi:hypothetical protein